MASFGGGFIEGVKAGALLAQARERDASLPRYGHGGGINLPSFYGGGTGRVFGGGHGQEEPERAERAVAPAAAAAAAPAVPELEAPELRQASDFDASVGDFLGGNFSKAVQYLNAYGNPNVNVQDIYRDKDGSIVVVPKKTTDKVKTAEGYATPGGVIQMGDKELPVAGVSLGKSPDQEMRFKNVDEFYKNFFAMAKPDRGAKGMPAPDPQEWAHAVNSQTGEVILYDKNKGGTKSASAGRTSAEEAAIEAAKAKAAAGGQGGVKLDQLMGDIQTYHNRIASITSGQDIMTAALDEGQKKQAVDGVTAQLFGLYTQMAAYYPQDYTRLLRSGSIPKEHAVMLASGFQGGDEPAPSPAAPGSPTAAKAAGAPAAAPAAPSVPVAGIPKGNGGAPNQAVLRQAIAAVTAQNPTLPIRDRQVMAEQLLRQNNYKW